MLENKTNMNEVIIPKGQVNIYFEGTQSSFVISQSTLIEALREYGESRESVEAEYSEQS